MLSPPLIKTTAPQGFTYDPFLSLGPRTPAYVISPFVKGSACVHNLFDHTSVLKFVAERFGNGSYSTEVDARPVESLSAALNFDSPILTPPPAPAMNTYLSLQPPSNPFTVTVPPPESDLQKAFRAGTTEMKRQGGDNHPTFGTLLKQVPV